MFLKNSLFLTFPQIGGGDTVADKICASIEPNFFLFFPGMDSDRLKRLIGNSDLGKDWKELKEDRKRRKLESKDKTWDERRSHSGGITACRPYFIHGR